MTLESEPIGVNGNAQAFTLLAPLDWGVAFAWSNLRRLVLLALIPIAFELVANYILFTERLLRQHMVLLFFVTMIGNVWLVSSTMMLCIDLCLEREIRLRQICFRALVNLPKVFGSYVLTLIVVIAGLGSFVVPGLIFMGFLLWAPAFCVGELYARSKEETKPKVELDDDDEIDFEAILRRRRSLFNYKSLWELGFVRSSRLAGTSYRYSMQLALMVLAANVIPVAAVDLVWGDSFGFSPQALKIVISSICGAFVLGIWAGTFVMLLPVDSRQELGIENYPDPNKLFPLRRFNLPSLEGRLAPHVILVGLTMLAGWSFVEQTKQRTLMPDNVLLEVSSAESTDGNLVIEMRLTDSAYQFRWLVPENFQIELEKPLAATAADNAVSAGDSSQSGAAGETATVPTSVGEKIQYLEPTKTQIYSLGDEPIAAETLSPYYEPLKLVLTYKLPKDAPSGEGDFAIAYMSPLSDPDVRYRGEYNPAW